MQVTVLYYQPSSGGDHGLLTLKFANQGMTGSTASPHRACASALLPKKTVVGHEPRPYDVAVGTKPAGGLVAVVRTNKVRLVGCTVAVAFNETTDTDSPAARSPATVLGTVPMIAG